MVGEWSGMGKLRGNGAAKGELDVRNNRAGRQIEHIFQLDAGFEGDIVNFARRLIVEMSVIEQIRTVAAGLAVEMNLPNDAMLSKSFETVVDGSQRNLRQFVFDVEKYVLSGGVNAIFHQGTIHFLALTRHAQAIDFLREIIVFGRCRRIADHSGRRETSPEYRPVKNDSYFYSKKLVPPPKGQCADDDGSTVAHSA